MSNKIKITLKNCLGYLLLAVTLICFYRCPVKLVFGIDCPGCGMTRAFLAALRFDYKSAFDYHPLFPVFGLETVYVFFHNIFPEKIYVPKKIEYIISICSLILLIAVWIIRRL